jgi:LPS export ABC transporter protein LptC
VSAKFYALLLVIAVLALFWYQDHYLKTLKGQAVHWEQVVQEVFPVASFDGTLMTFYEKNILKKTLSAKEVVQYNDNSFTLQGAIQYENYNPQGKKTLLVRSNFAMGQWDPKKEALIFLNLPGQVHLEFLGYTGQAQDVHFDEQKKTLRSDRPFELIGPGGTLAATGFTYWIEDEAFEFDSRVQGEALPPVLKKGFPR